MSFIIPYFSYVFIDYRKMQYYKFIFSILVFVILLATLIENVRNRRKGEKKDKKVTEDSL